MIVRVVLFGEGVGKLVIELPRAGEGLAAQRVGLDVADFLALADFGVDFAAAIGNRGAGDGDDFLVHLAELELVADFVISVLVVQGAQVEVRGFIQAIVEVQDNTDTLTGKVIPAHLIVIVGHEIGAVLRLFEVGAIDLAPAAGLVVVGLDAQVLVVGREGHAQLVAEGVGVGERRFRRDLLGDLVVAAFHFRPDELAITVERRNGLHVDHAAQRVGIDIRGQGFLDFDPVQQIRRHAVQQDTAAVFRRWCTHAVDGGGDQVGVDAADRDVSAFALVVLDRETRNAAERVGDRCVGEVAEAVGVHNGDDGVGGTLLVDRAGLGGGGADHEHIVHVADIAADREVHGGGASE